MKSLMIPCIFLGCEGEDAEKEITAAEEMAKAYRDKGADALMVFDLSRTDEAHEKVIGCIRKICGCAEVPVMGGGHINRLEDVKKIIYAGCAKAILDFSGAADDGLLPEASKRFGKDRMVACISAVEELEGRESLLEEYAESILLSGASREDMERLREITDLPVIAFVGNESGEAVLRLLQTENAAGISGAFFKDPDKDIRAFKETCRENGIEVKSYESSIDWSLFKLDSCGLIPVIVQDYKTSEVLMLAYMNEEAFRTTIRSGRMTYWSRSRNELWVKGLTSGHFQYVKELALDCDGDTILAKVDQIGAACHTGSRSCFFRTLLKKDYDNTNPLSVFQDVYDVILDRKNNPKEGSYTNYLFDKGIDKILKKVGEECTEIVIAAKNPDKEEIKYEISDFLYHVMVLMAVKGITWDEVTRELARR